MTRKIHAALMTMNAQFDVIPTIERVLPYVDSFTVVEGSGSDETFLYLHNWRKHEPKLRVYLYPWTDFPTQRNNYLKHIAEIASEGDWIVVQDSDERLSDETLQNLHSLIDSAEAHNAFLISLRCYSVTMEGPKEVWRNFDDYAKPLIFRWSPNLRYTGFKVHETLEGIPHKVMQAPEYCTYTHHKQSDAIWIRGMRNLYHGGGGPNLGSKNPFWGKLRKITDEKLQLPDWQAFHAYIRKGDIDDELRQLFIDHALDGTDRASPVAVSKEPWDGASEVRECYKTTYRLYHQELEPEELKGVWIP